MKTSPCDDLVFEVDVTEDECENTLAGDQPQEVITSQIVIKSLKTMQFVYFFPILKINLIL